MHAGGDSPVGHTLPGDRTVPEGELLHVDFGVVRDGYAADVQRIWVRGEAGPELTAAFRDVRAAIDAGPSALSRCLHRSSRGDALASLTGTLQSPNSS